MQLIEALLPIVVQDVAAQPHRSRSKVSGAPGLPSGQAAGPVRMRNEDVRQAQLLKRAVARSIHEAGGLGHESLESKDCLGLALAPECSAVPGQRREWLKMSEASMQCDIIHMYSLQCH